MRHVLCPAHLLGCFCVVDLVPVRPVIHYSKDMGGGLAGLGILAFLSAYILRNAAKGRTYRGTPSELEALLA